MKQQEVDVVVVGSGIGGMAAAALLSHSGYQVIVVEKLPFVGGRFTTLDYQGFKLFTGAAVVETGGVIEKVLTEVGAQYDIIQANEVRYRVQGRDYELPSKGQLRALLSLGSENEADRAEVDKLLPALRRSMVWQEPSRKSTFLEWVTQYTTSKRIIDILQGWTYAMLGPNMDEVPADQFACFNKLVGGFKGFGFASGGLSSVTEWLTEVVRAKGGEVWTKSPAKQILIQDGVCKGVVVKKQDKDMDVLISAKSVISDIGPRKTVELAESRNFDMDYLKELRETPPPLPVMVLHVVSDKPLMEYPGFLVLTGLRRVFSAISPTNTCAEYAPRGKHLLVIWGMPKSTMLPVHYREELELCLQDVREQFPLFEKHAKVLSANVLRGEWPAIRCRAGYPMRNKTSVELLYNVGDAVVQPGYYGGMGAVDTAVTVVDDLKKRIKPGKV